MLEPFLEVCEHKITESRAIGRRKRLLWMWKIGAQKLFLGLKFSFAQAKTEEKTLSGDWAPSRVWKKTHSICIESYHRKQI